MGWMHGWGHGMVSAGWWWLAHVPGLAVSVLGLYLLWRIATALERRT